MSKEGSKIVKNASRKKVNHYTKLQCESELARMNREPSDSNKDGMQSASKYYKDIQKQLLILG